MVSRKYVKEFLEATAEEIALKNKYHAAFFSRFNPSNKNRTSADLAQILQVVKPGVTYLNHVRASMTALEQIGCPQVVKGKGGRSSTGEEVWRKPYQWLWDEYYLKWLNDYESNSKERILANSLLSLNFKEQIDKLEEIIASQPISTFCIDVSPSTTITKWTFKTLVEKVFELLDEPFVIFKQTPEYTQSIDWFWYEIKQCIGEDIPAEKEEELLNRLIEISFKRSVLIILTEVNNLNLRPDLEQKLVKDFFVRLIQYSKASALSFGHHIVILMIREHCDQIFSGAVLVDELNSDALIESNISPIVLKPLTCILGKEVRQWLMKKRKTLEPIMGQNYQKLAKEMQTWDKTNAMNKSPLKIIEKICKTSGLEGVSAVENHWRIESMS